VIPPRFIVNGSIVAAPATFDTAFRFGGNWAPLYGGCEGDLLEV
jgi:hypothetical protein